MRLILIVSENPDDLASFSKPLKTGFRAFHSATIPDALEFLKKRRCDFLLIHIEMIDLQDRDFSEALAPFFRSSPCLRIIVMARPQMIRRAVYAVKAGAADYVTYPINPEELTHVLDSVIRSHLRQAELDHLRDCSFDTPEVVQTRCQEMEKVIQKSRSVAPTRSTVLLSGETGTGKGVFARLIHRLSHRGREQFIGVHCGAIADTLVESELFGHEKGAFTGATRRKLGRFEIARGGTIFLDEIGTITLQVQIKLLEVLQDHTFSRVGGEESIEADVRVIAATNADLNAMVAEGKFRKDLFYRLNVFPIEIPPLRERAVDIPLFVDFFLNKLNLSHMKNIQGIHPEAMAALMRYEWPGNIRELENILERAYILETGNRLTPDAFPGEFFEPGASFVPVAADTSVPLAVARQEAVSAMERAYLKELLETQKGRIKPAAQAAGISTRQLSKLMNRYGLHKEDYKA